MILEYRANTSLDTFIEHCEQSTLTVLRHKLDQLTTDEEVRTACTACNAQRATCSMQRAVCRSICVAAICADGHLAWFVIGREVGEATYSARHGNSRGTC